METTGLVKSLNVLLIGYVWPERTSSAAGLRDWNLVEAIVGAGWKLTYACAAQRNIFSDELERAGVEVVSIQVNHSDFDRWVSGLKPDLVVFDRFITEEQFGWRVFESSPDSIRVLDTQDLHFLRRAREHALKEGKSLAEIAFCEFELRTETALREVASIYRCDQTLVLSDFESRLLQDRFQIPKDLIYLSRFHYPEPDEVPEFHEREHFVVLGNFRHPPNADGIRWLKSEIWPLIRKALPEVRVHIYGAYPPKEIMNLSDPNMGFHVLGPVKDQFQVLRKARVNLAPLRFGAGIKGKIADGWWSGTPVVTTVVGAEGMAEGLAWGGAIAATAYEFAQLAVAFYQDQAQWQQGQENGLKIIRTLYNKRENAINLVRNWFFLKENGLAMRKKNFVGSLLWHHQHQSTKYFSRWIEEKNSKTKML